MINDLDAINGILTVPDGTAAIDDGEFAGREDIIELYLPDSVRSLGIEAFCGCTQLKAPAVCAPGDKPRLLRRMHRS